MSVGSRIEAKSINTKSFSVFLILIYTATVFLSAALLFAIQPMFAKMVLPRFGG
jgi:hypothetical protein